MAAQQPEPAFIVAAGRVVDITGSPLPGASVVLRCRGRQHETVTAQDGRFRVADAPRERCLVTVSQDGFLTARSYVDLGGAAPRLDFRLQLTPIASEVIVTAARGIERDASQIEQGASRVDRAELDARPYTIVTQALREEVGVLSQQTTTAQGSPVLRGFTGQRNFYALDGVRYNTAMWRDGPSQYLAWLPSAALDRIEIVRGPNSAQYGSDALGGAISFFTQQAHSITARGVQAAVDVTLASANALRGSNVRLAGSRSMFSYQLGAGINEVNDLRAGKGIDSRAAVTRFLGLPSSIAGRTLQNTGYRQTSGTVNLGWQLAPDRTLTAEYVHASQTGAHRYDQERGGSGNYRSEFGPQQLDFGFLRYATGRLGWLDSFSATWSLNRQADGSLMQARPHQRIDERVNTVTAFGYQAQGMRAMGTRTVAIFGADYYDEYIAGDRTLTEPNGTTAKARPDIPDGTRYGSLGLFWQQSADVVPGRVQARAGLRYGRYAFSSRPDATLGVTEESVMTDDVTFNGGVIVSVTPTLNLTASVSRGFRAANAFDFAAIGLSGGAGFEISPSRAIALGAGRGSTDGSTAVRTGAAIEPLQPEEVVAYEAGIRWHAQRVSASATIFNLDSRDLIERRTLIFDSNIVGQDVAGYTIVRQDAAGRAYVEGEARPIVTRVNVNHARIRGFEAEATARVAASWRARVWGSMANGRDLDSRAFLRRMPPATAAASLLWQRAGSRVWVEGVAQSAFEQTRLSDADLGDARIGARRTASSIASFFNGPAVDMGLVSGGILRATGETLAQVQSRVLATGGDMFKSTAGYLVVSVRGGLPLSSRADLILIGENLTDRNYRLHGSGVDEPGINVQARLRLRF